MDIYQGKHNRIPEGTFREWQEGKGGPVQIGDCNTIHENVRILVGPDGFRLGDWNMIHHDCFLGGPKALSIGHNCWVGQGSILDSTGGLTIGNGVSFGAYSSLWTHIARGEQIEGWLCQAKPTELDDDVWLVGDNVHVAAGVWMGMRSVALAHAVVTKDVLADTVVAGSPAQPINYRLRRHVTLQEKLDLMWAWALEFKARTASPVRCECDKTNVTIWRGDERCVFTSVPLTADHGPSASIFRLDTKTYTKRLSELEREVYAFLKANKARFIPEKE